MFRGLLEAAPDAIIIVNVITTPAAPSADLAHNPIIAVTSFAMVGDRERVLAAGFTGYLSKPINPETFVPEFEAFLPIELRAHRAGPA